MDVSFSGYDSGHGSSPNYPNKVAQMQKAVALEYGTAKEPAQPFLNSAANSCGLGRTGNRVQQCLIC